MEITTIKMTKREREYAASLSRNMPGCPRPMAGSWAHCFKFWLHEYAKDHMVDIGPFCPEAPIQTKEDAANKIRLWKKTEAGKLSLKKIRAKRMENNPDKVRANGALRYAVWSGKVVRPDSCAACGASGCRISGHHHNGYSKEHRLDVVWLCDVCHKNAHYCE